MKRFLITTALEETWNDDEPVLFLGEWCRQYSHKERWSKMDAEVLPYHWDDRNKLYVDYQYLQKFYERLLRELTVQLNQIHSTEHSLRYWRILIGPWLGYFTQILFDRWTSIQQAINQHQLSGTIVLGGNEDMLVPNDMEDMARLFVSDEWNHLLYANILQKAGNVSCEIKKRSNSRSVPFVVPISRAKKVKKYLTSLASSVASTFSRDSDLFFFNTYLPIKEELKLQLQCHQLPQRWRKQQTPKVPVDLAQRQWIVSGNSESEFEKFTRWIISQQIPTIYLEGYTQLVYQSERLLWPKKPKLICTSYSLDDVLKIWIAEKVEKGSPLVLNQYGGHYGLGRWSFVEDHEMAICDRYLSWGWDNPNQPKIKPIGQFKLKSPLNVNHAEQDGMLLVCNVVPRYSYFMYSITVSRQWLDYFDEQCSFITHLPENVRKALTVRLHSSDYGWSQMARWREQFSDLHIDDGQTKINQLITKSKLYVSTYNATTFLESFSMNVPTIIYWNPSHWELRDSAIPYFEMLKQVGIFHDSPESAASHVVKIWDNVDAWWNSESVTIALEKFKHRYSRIPRNIVEDTKCIIHEVLSDNNES
jgi:putative transferase (TIGR04331 family)